MSKQCCRPTSTGSDLFPTGEDRRARIAALERQLAEAREKLARIELEACVCDQIRYPLSQGCIVHDKQSVIARILKEG